MTRERFAAHLVISNRVESLDSASGIFILCAVLSPDKRATVPAGVTNLTVVALCDRDDVPTDRGQALRGGFSLLVDSKSSWLRFQRCATARRQLLRGSAVAFACFLSCSAVAVCFCSVALSVLCGGPMWLSFFLQAGGDFSDILCETGLVPCSISHLAPPHRCLRAQVVTGIQQISTNKTRLDNSWVFRDSSPNALPHGP